MPRVRFTSKVEGSFQWPICGWFVVIGISKELVTMKKKEFFQEIVEVSINLEIIIAPISFPGETKPGSGQQMTFKTISEQLRYQ